MELGLGTYGGPVDRPLLQGALAAGVTVVDTAPNYMSGRAHALLGEWLSEIDACAGLRVTTKYGFAVDGEGRSHHSLEPAAFRSAVSSYPDELGQPPEVVYLHNPERALCTLDPRRGADLLCRVFEAAEDAAEAGTFEYYGVATWRLFDERRPVVGWLTVETMLDAARRAGGDHHRLRHLQLPVNLLRPDLLLATLQNSGPIHEATSGGLVVAASSPLAGGNILDLVSGEVVAYLDAPTTDPATVALGIVASMPGVDRILVSSSDATHVEENLAAVAAGTIDRHRLTDLLTLIVAEP